MHGDGDRTLDSGGAGEVVQARRAAGFEVDGFGGLGGGKFSSLTNYVFGNAKLGSRCARLCSAGRRSIECAKIRSEGCKEQECGDRSGEMQRGEVSGGHGCALVWSADGCLTDIFVKGEKERQEG